MSTRTLFTLKGTEYVLLIFLKKWQEFRSGRDLNIFKN